MDGLVASLTSIPLPLGNRLSLSRSPDPDYTAHLLGGGCPHPEPHGPESRNHLIPLALGIQANGAQP